MSPFEPHKRAYDDTTLWETTTTSGVQVIVRDIHLSPVLPPPRVAAEPPEQHPRVVIVPPEPPPMSADMFIKELYERHGEFIRKTLLRRKDVLEESAKDVQQRMLINLRERFEKDGAPRNERGLIIRVLRNEVRNHNDRWRPDIEHGAEADAEPCAAPNPEEAAVRAESLAKLARYVRLLPPEEAEVVECIDFVGLTIDETVEVVERRRSTVADQHKRARDRLSELALASERETALGKRRR